MIVIDDDPVVRDLVKAILEQEGYKVLPAENGKEGVSL
ncbi:MAG: DNA-binding response regulator, partial [Candidatus Dadabacteria bacterium]